MNIQVTYKNNNNERDSAPVFLMFTLYSEKCRLDISSMVFLDVLLRSLFKNLNHLALKLTN